MSERLQLSNDDFVTTLRLLLRLPVLPTFAKLYKRSSPPAPVAGIQAAICYFFLHQQMTVGQVSGMLI